MEFDWNDPNSVYVFTGVMTEEDRLANVVTTSAWTIGFWDELSKELRAHFDEIVVYSFAKERGQLLFDIKTNVEDSTPFYQGAIKLSDGSASKIENMVRSKAQTPAKIQAILQETIEQTFLERIDAALDKRDEEEFQRQTNFLHSYRQSIHA